MIAAGSTQGDVTNIAAACQSVASSQGIDARVLLAMILQESTGYVGVETTTNVDGSGTGGLMQASGCQGYPGQNGLSAVRILKPRPTLFLVLLAFAGRIRINEQGTRGHNSNNCHTIQDQIKTMISCGTTHLATNLQSHGGKNTVDAIYPALREYNSGSVDTSDLSVAPNGAGVTSYVSDIAQRLQGKVF